MKYTERHEEIVELCRTALTYTEVEARLGVTTPSTGLRRYIKQREIPLPLYEGQKISRKRSRTHKVDLCENSRSVTSSVKRYLIRTGKLEACEKCGWDKHRPSDGKIPIHLHHKNGDSTDNRMENLEFLCPCCHALTDTYAGKNKMSKRRGDEHLQRQLYYSSPKNVCQTCGKLGYGDKFCSVKCSHVVARKVVWPTREELEKDLLMISQTAIGRKYGVSDTAVRKWKRYYNLA